MAWAPLQSEEEAYYEKHRTAELDYAIKNNEPIPVHDEDLVDFQRSPESIAAEQKGMQTDTHAQAQEVIQGNGGGKNVDADVDNEELELPLDGDNYKFGDLDENKAGSEDGSPIETSFGKVSHIEGFPVHAAPILPQRPHTDLHIPLNEAEEAQEMKLIERKLTLDAIALFDLMEKAGIVELKYPPVTKPTREKNTPVPSPTFTIHQALQTCVLSADGIGNFWLLADTLGMEQNFHGEVITIKDADAIKRLREIHTIEELKIEVEAMIHKPEEKEPQKMVLVHVPKNALVTLPGGLETTETRSFADQCNAVIREMAHLGIAYRRKKADFDAFPFIQSPRDGFWKVFDACTRGESPEVDIEDQRIIEQLREAKTPQEIMEKLRFIRELVDSAKELLPLMVQAGVATIGQDFGETPNTPLLEAISGRVSLKHSWNDAFWTIIGCLYGATVDGKGRKNNFLKLFDKDLLVELKKEKSSDDLRQKLLEIIRGKNGDRGRAIIPRSGSLPTPGFVSADTSSVSGSVTTSERSDQKENKKKQALHPSPGGIGVWEGPKKKESLTLGQRIARQQRQYKGRTRELLANAFSEVTEIAPDHNEAPAVTPSSQQTEKGKVDAVDKTKKKAA